MEESNKETAALQSELAALRVEVNQLRAERASIEGLRAQLEQRDAARNKDWSIRAATLADREKQLAAARADLDVRLHELEQRKDEWSKQVAAQTSKIAEQYQLLEQEKARYKEEGRKRIAESSAQFVQEALQSLDRKESRFHIMAKIWSGIGAGALIVGILFLAYTTLGSFTGLPNPLTWPFVAFAAFRGLVVVGVLVALARYAYLFSGGYMREALKNADREHAINFGKFYLESFGVGADWPQVKEAFENWNIAASNSFITPGDGLDMSAVEKAVALLERVGKAFAKPKSDD